MTEEEAKTKWCPFARGVATVKSQIPHGVPVFNRQGDINTPQVLIPAMSLCIASVCMAWRWRVEEFEAAQEHFEQTAPPGSTGPEIQGYCGLAGSPQ